MRVVDYMDRRPVVQAARVSYGAGTKRVHEDRGLIRYLLRHAHTTPFEMCEITLHVRVPMDTWRQWIRHRRPTSTSTPRGTRSRSTPPNTRRRGVAPPVHRQPPGHNGSCQPHGEALTAAEASSGAGRQTYEARLAAGVAREQARKDLPLSTYTEAYWKVDLHNLLHFLQLRMDDHAQEEIRAYAALIGDEIEASGCQSRGRRSTTTGASAAAVADRGRGGDRARVRVARRAHGQLPNRSASSKPATRTDSWRRAASGASSKTN